jgi:hypothetical protein
MRQGRLDRRAYHCVKDQPEKLVLVMLGSEKSEGIPEHKSLEKEQKSREE